VIVVGGNDYKILTGPAPSLLLWLMAEDKNVNVKELGHFVERLLTDVSAPGQKVS
jgi:hypothetical protein